MALIWSDEEYRAPAEWTVQEWTRYGRKVHRRTVMRRYWSVMVYTLQVLGGVLLVALLWFTMLVVALSM